MKYRPYLSGCADVSEIGVGGWQLSDSAVWSSMSDAEATSLVHHALDLGINFFDTAPNYGLGTSEQRLGSALKGVDRDRFIINTKFGHNAEDEFDFESSSLRDSVEGSLRRLGVETIDSLLLHNPPAEYLDGNHTDHYEILDALVAEGKIKGYGASLDTYNDMKPMIQPELRLFCMMSSVAVCLTTTRAVSAEVTTALSSLAIVRTLQCLEALISFVFR